jgi:hypothetical protein
MLYCWYGDRICEDGDAKLGPPLPPFQQKKDGNWNYNVLSFKVRFLTSFASEMFSMDASQPSIPVFDCAVE